MQLPPSAGNRVADSNGGKMRVGPYAIVVDYSNTYFLTDVLAVDKHKIRATQETNQPLSP